MKHLRRAYSLALAFALALSLSLTSASAVEVTVDNATSFIDVQFNIDVDNEVFIDEADAVDYYNPYWGRTYSNTGYFAFERDTSITVTYLPGADDTDNEISEPFVWIALFPFRSRRTAPMCPRWGRTTMATPGPTSWVWMGSSG